MDTTPKGWPYPEPADSIEDYPAVAQAFAEKLDALGERAYVQRTTSQTVATTTEGTAQVVLTAPAITVVAGTILVIEIFSPGAQPDSASIRTLDSMIFEDGNVLARISRKANTVPNPLDYGTELAAKYRHAPAAGAHTYSWRALVNAGLGIIQAGVGGSNQLAPMFLRITAVDA